MSGRPLLPPVPSALRCPPVRPRGRPSSRPKGTVGSDAQSFAANLAANLPRKTSAYDHRCGCRQLLAQNYTLDRMGTTTPLRRALKHAFFPHVEKSGFIADLRDQPRSTVFRRATGGVVQMFELQWEKYGKPRFSLNFGTCPAAGMHIQGQLHIPENVFPTWCPDAGTLRPRRGATTLSWFRQDRSFLQRLFRRPALREPSEVVGQVQKLFPELERYWSTGEVGRHMCIWSSRPHHMAHNAV